MPSEYNRLAGASDLKNLPEIATLWIGGRLSWLEQLCLKSFVDAGHHTTLYSYAPIDNPPEGVHLADAEDIFPSEPMLRHARTGSPAIHADMWRLHLLKKTDKMISNGSCTTTCLAPLAKVMHEAIGIESGLMTTIHSYTGDQPTLDRRHNDLYRARAAAMALIPTSTGAAKALGEVLPALKGKLDGTAMRVPTPNVSAVDLTFQASRDVTVEEINAAARAAADGPMKRVLAYDPEQKVSIDFNHTEESCIFAPDQTIVVAGRTVRVLGWYDNEWAFSVRMADVAVAMGKLG